MGTASEAFRLIETGGDPRLHPDLDYTLCIPLLVSRYSLASLPFLVRYPQTWTASRYRDLDYRLIQRQAMEEMQLEKQTVGVSSSASKIRLFETGTDEDRARIVLVELVKLRQDPGKQTAIHLKQLEHQEDSALFNNPIYRLEVATLLAMCTLRCSRPLLNIQSIVHSLRLLRDPTPLIASLLANHPAEIMPTIDSILDMDQHHGGAKAILSRLCKLADHKVWEVRQRLVERRVFSNLAIELTIEYCHDEICFMNRIIRGQPDWLKTGVDPVTKTSLSSIMEFVFSSLNDELISDQPDHVAVNRLLRILCGMTALMNMSLSAEQLEISLGVLEMTPLEPSTVDVKMCLIVMSASQLLKYSQPRVERVLHKMISCQNSPQVLNLLLCFQRQQLGKIDDFVCKALSMTVVVPRGGLMELSGLFSTVFSSEELFSSALSIGRLDAGEAWRVGSSDTSTLGTPSWQQRYDSGYNGSGLRSTANYIVGHLLQQDVFCRSATAIQPWIMEQIQASTVPLDANMIHLLRAYTSAIARSKSIARIPEQEVRAHFNDPCENPTPAKVLLVLYMLMYNDICISSQGESGMERLPEYSSTLLEFVQVRKVALYVQNLQGGMAFQAVQPFFLKLVNAQFPELFDVTTLLQEEGMATSSWRKAQALPVLGTHSERSHMSAMESLPSVNFKRSAEIMEPHLQAIAQHLSCADSAVKGYHAFQRLPQEDRQKMAGDIVRASLPSLLDPRSSPAVMEAFKNTWDQLNSVMPHEIWAVTIQALLPQSSTSLPLVSSSKLGHEVQQHKSYSQHLAKHQTLQQRQQQQQEYQTHISQQNSYTFEWLVQDPLLLFKVDFRVFRSPTIFRLFIQVLGAVMTGSRHWFRKQYHASQSIPQPPQNRSLPPVQRRQFKEVNLSAMLYIQDSALVQLLLEACEAKAEDRKPHTSATETELGDGFGAGRARSNGSHTSGAIDSPVGDVSEALQEVRVVTFNFLHQLFIDHKIFPKLVHFQGYAMDLLPATVAGIDSIHVCLDFLQELLFANAPSSMLANASGASSSALGAGMGADPGDDRMDASPQIFALRLAAHLCERFPLQKTLQMAVELILPKLQALARTTELAKEVLESAVILAKAFPSLRDDIVDILQETSTSQNKIALQKTIDAINQELLDPAISDKSLL